MIDDQPSIPKRIGRPRGSTQTAEIPKVRCEPELRAMWDELGGADWQRQAVAQAHAKLVLQRKRAGR